MATLELERSYLSVARILRSSNPKEELANELVTFLGIHLRPLGIHWNPKAFRAGLNNPDLPEELLRKLEDFINVAELLDWSVPRTVVEELDLVIEDIESFNPGFLGKLRTSRSSGRVSATSVRRRLGL